MKTSRLSPYFPLFPTFLLQTACFFCYFVCHVGISPGRAWKTSRLSPYFVTLTFSPAGLSQVFRNKLTSVGISGGQFLTLSWSPEKRDEFSISYGAGAQLALGAASSSRGWAFGWSYYWQLAPDKTVSFVDNL